MNITRRNTLLATLSTRFENNKQRHPDIAWAQVVAKLEAHADGLRTLDAMEASGGEPDVIGQDAESGAYVFVDCSAESPAGRRSVCYDGEALLARKTHKPAHSATEMAAEMGAELLTEDVYRTLQKIGNFDLKTSSWIYTPPAIRKLGGALFCDRRYDQVFVYHNGAQSYYATRGFRVMLRV